MAYVLWERGRYPPCTAAGTMRWTAYTAALSPAVYAGLVNTLTAGQGYAYLAAHMAAGNRDTSSVLRHLRQAHRQLTVARRLLLALEEAWPPPSPAPTDSEPRPVRWRAFLATLPADDAAALSQALADAAIDARRVAEGARADGEVEDVQHRLDQALLRLAEALRLCGLPDP